MSMASSRIPLEVTIKEALPEQFKDKLIFTQLHDDMLIFTCHSAKIMTQFRFFQDEVIASLNRTLSPRRIKTIKIKIRPNNLSTPRSKIEVKRTLSKKNAQILLEEAEHTEDSELKDILITLAKHSC